MDELIAFLNDRLDEDETVARAAAAAVAAERWHHSLHMNQVVTPTPHIAVYDTGVFGVVKPVANWDEDGPDPLLEHIARHDPARVLADVAAKREIIALHAPFDAWADIPGPHGPQIVCRECAGARMYPCPTLRVLAAPYAEHPDYRQEWKP